MLVIGHAVAEVLVDVAPILEGTCRACGEEASGGGWNLAVRLDCAPQEPQNSPFGSVNPAAALAAVEAGGSVKNSV
jgi:hypothetical protein